MIIKIYSDLKTFKTLEFKPGLNILVSEKHEDSGKRDSRNGSGKTSMIELLHFLMQVRSDKKDDFHKESLLGKKFSAIFEENGKKFDISRRSDPKKDEAFLDSKSIDARGLQREFAQQWFDLSSEETEEKYTPKFSSLFSFFVRKDRNGAFEEAIKNASVQKPWDSQINIAYLLGFDWRLIQRLQQLKDEKKQIDNFLTMIKEEYFSDTPLDLNKMEAERTILEGRIEQKRKEIDSSKVFDGYEEYEIEANNLTKQISGLNEANLYDLSLQADIDQALMEVKDADKAEIEGVYKQVQLYFTERVKKRFEDVQNFHKQVAENRKIQLDKEKRAAQQRIDTRRIEIDKLQVKLKSKIDILKSHIAFKRMAALQSDLNQLEAERNDLNIQILRLRDAKAKKADLQRKIKDQVDLIGDDVQERKQEYKFAINSFEEVSRYLYEENGILALGATEREGGLDISIEIKAKKSGGKNHMQIFCFDWVLAQAAKRQDKFPGFLVHDSHIFDGVDGRQIGLALRFAQEKCEQSGIQYIVAINSDDLDKIKAAEKDTGKEIFDPAAFIIGARLSDDEAGGLFGVRF